MAFKRQKSRALSSACGLVCTAFLSVAADTGWTQSLQNPVGAEAAETDRIIRQLIAKDPSRAADINRTVEEAKKPPRTREERGSRRERSRRIVNGRGTFDVPAAGALLKGTDRRSAKVWCSGTLVSCDQFLTAAHCVAEDAAPASYKVFFQNAGFFDVKEIRKHPGYRPQDPGDDIALLTLAKPVLDIAPIEINQIATPAIGLEGRIVGFGRTGGDNYDYGLKREGTIRTASWGGTQRTRNWFAGASMRRLRQKTKYM